MDLTITRAVARSIAGAATKLSVFLATNTTGLHQWMLKESVGHAMDAYNVELAAIEQVRGRRTAICLVKVLFVVVRVNTIYESAIGDRMYDIFGDKYVGISKVDAGIGFEEGE